MSARALAVAFAALVVSLLTLGTERDPHQRVLFMKSHPCPANGKTRGACPGYVVDHINPLCADGPDRPSNMQWQTVADAKVKDNEERKILLEQSSMGQPMICIAVAGLVYDVAGAS